MESKGRISRNSTSAEEVESCAIDEDFEVQEQREDGDGGENHDINKNKVYSELSKTFMEESIEGIQEELSYESRADSELPLSR